MAKSQTATASPFNGTMDNHTALDLACSETMSPVVEEDDKVVDGHRNFAQLPQQQRVPIVAPPALSNNVNNAKLLYKPAPKTMNSGDPLHAVTTASTSNAAAPTAAHIGKAPRPVGPMMTVTGPSFPNAAIAINNHHDNNAVYVNSLRSMPATNSAVFTKSIFKPYNANFNPVPNPSLPTGLLASQTSNLVNFPNHLHPSYASTTIGTSRLPALSAAQAESAAAFFRSSIIQQQAMIANTVLNIAGKLGNPAAVAQSQANVLSGFVIPAASKPMASGTMPTSVITPTKPLASCSPNLSSGSSTIVTPGSVTGIGSTTPGATPTASQTTPGPSPRPSILRKFRDGQTGVGPSPAVRKLALDSNSFDGKRPASAAAAMASNGAVLRTDSPCGGEESNHSSMSCSSVHSSIAAPGSPGIGDLNSPRKQRLRKQKFDQYAPPEKMELGAASTGGGGNGQKKRTTEIPLWRLAPPGSSEQQTKSGHGKQRPGRPLSRPSTAPLYVTGLEATVLPGLPSTSKSKPRRVAAPVAVVLKPKEEPSSEEESSEEDDEDEDDFGRPSTSRSSRRQFSDESDRMSPPVLRVPSSPSEIVPFSRRFPSTKPLSPVEQDDNDEQAPSEPLYRPRPRLTNSYVLGYSPRRNHFKRYDMIKLASAAKRGKLDAAADLEATFARIEYDRRSEAQLMDDDDEDAYRPTGSTPMAPVSSSHREAQQLAASLIGDANFVGALAQWRLNRISDLLTATDRYEEENGERLAKWARNAGSCVAAASSDSVDWWDRWSQPDEEADCCDEWMMPPRASARSPIAPPVNGNGNNLTVIDDDADSVAVNPSSHLLNQVLKLKSPYLCDWLKEELENEIMNNDDGEPMDTDFINRLSECDGERSDAETRSRIDLPLFSNGISDESSSRSLMLLRPRKRWRAAAIRTTVQLRTRRLRELAATMARRNAAVRALVAEVRVSFRQLRRHGTRLEKCVRRLAIGADSGGASSRKTLRSSVRSAGLRVSEQLPSH